MYNFNFYNPTRILFGKDKIEELDRLLPRNAKILITYGGGSAKKYGLIGKITPLLKGRTIIEFGGIEPNPSYTTLMKAVEIVRKEQIDFILAVGGGSVIDGTKFISLAAHFKGESLDLLKFCHAQTITEAVPFGSVLTLPATGSEMNCGAVISHESAKFVVMNELGFPKFSVLDPEVTFTLPKDQVANGVVDAFVHVCEQYITFAVDAKIQDRFAEGILQTLIEIGASNIEDTKDYNARANLVWSATMALNGLIGAGVPQDWTTHMIGHQITALFGIDHAKTLAIVLPAVLEIRKDKKRDKLIQYAENVWHINNGNDDEKINTVIQKSRTFFESLGIKTRLSDYGLTKDDIELVINNLEKYNYTKLSETRDLTIDISRKILETAL